MAIPIQYNIRNLKLRKSATIMTALGIALTVTTAIFIMALLAGLNAAFRSSGNPLNVLVLRKGATAELTAGGVDRDALPIMKELPGVASDPQGQAMVSGEDLLVIVLPRRDGSGDANVTVRFMTPIGIEMRPEVKLLPVGAGLRRGRGRSPSAKRCMTGLDRPTSATRCGSARDRGRWLAFSTPAAPGTIPRYGATSINWLPTLTESPTTRC